MSENKFILARVTASDGIHDNDVLDVLDEDLLLYDEVVDFTQPPPTPGRSLEDAIEELMSSRRAGQRN